MADATNLPGIPFSSLPVVTELNPDADVYVVGLDLSESDPANRNKRIPLALIANPSVPDENYGNVFPLTVSVEMEGGHDTPHLNLMNPAITDSETGEKRAEIVLHSTGLLTLRNLTAQPIVLTNSNFQHNNFILDDDGNLIIRGTVTANGVLLGAGTTDPDGPAATTLALFDPAKEYQYNAAAPELILYAVDGKLRIWTLKNTADTNTLSTRLAPSYADNSQWQDVGKDVFESVAATTVYEEWLAQPGNAGKTFADFMAAITGPPGADAFAVWQQSNPGGTLAQYNAFIKGEPGEPGYTPVKDVDYFDGEDGYTPVKGVDYTDGYTPQKGIDYFDGLPGADAITAWLALNPGKTLADYNTTFQGPEGPQGEGALFYRVLSTLPNEAALPIGPADPRDAYIIEDANGIPHIWLWLPGPAVWYDLGASSQVQLPPEEIDPALLDSFYLKTGGTITGLVEINHGGGYDAGHLTLRNPNITGKKNDENRAEILLHNDGPLTFRNVTHDPIIFKSGEHAHNNLIIDDNGNVIIRGNVWANGVLLGQPAPPEGVEWVAKPATPTISGLAISVGAGSLDNAGTVVNIAAKTLGFTYSGPNTERIAAIIASTSNPSQWLLQNGAAYPEGGEVVYPVIPVGSAVLTYVRISDNTATIPNSTVTGLTEERVQEIVTEQLAEFEPGDDTYTYLSGLEGADDPAKTVLKKRIENGVKVFYWGSEPVGTTEEPPAAPTLVINDTLGTDTATTTLLPQFLNKADYEYEFIPS